MYSISKYSEGKGGVESNILRVKIPEMIWETIFKDDNYNFLNVTTLNL